MWRTKRMHVCIYIYMKRLSGAALAFIIPALGSIRFWHFQSLPVTLWNQSKTDLFFALIFICSGYTVCTFETKKGYKCPVLLTTL